MSDIVKQSTIFDNCLKLEINRPEALNALNSDVISTLRVIISELNAEFKKSKAEKSFRADFPRVVIITGTGPKAFVAGADISALGSPNAENFLDQGISLMADIEQLPIPTLALVNGFCLGGGLELALSCDLIVATENAKLGLPELSLGVIPGFGGTQRLISRTSIGVARRIILTGEKISAGDAFSAGIVDLVLSLENTEEELKKFVGNIKKISPLALEAAKLALYHADTNLRKSGLEKERELFIGLLKTNDAKEGFLAFLEKRQPNFKGA